MKQRLFTIPGLGYVLRMVWLVARLPHLVDIYDRQFAAGDSDRQAMQTQLEAKSAELEAANSRSVKHEDQLDELKHRLSSLEKVKRPVAGTTAAGGSALLADNHDLDSFYIKFENKFRGTEDEIKSRLKVYLSYFHRLQVDFGKHPVLDIGCGRGELLSLLKDEDIRCIGLDLNESMVNRCQELGYEAVQANALDYLAAQPSGSLAAITGFHIVEHLPFDMLLQLFEECHRVLVPGGIIIFETPNPESLHVGSYAFYYDPSHLHPLVPDVLAFTVENRGFDKAEILRLHPKGDGKANATRKDKYVTEVLDRFYGPQDYAVIGYKLGAGK